jgi:membrane protease YdiL (CAAX protease family)
MNVLSPEESRTHSVFSFVGIEGAGAGRWIMLGFLALLAWAGGVAYLGPYRPNDVSRMLAGFAPLETIYLASLAISVLISVVAVAFRHWSLAWAAGTVAGYLGGFVGMSVLFSQMPPGVVIPLGGVDDALNFALSRLWFAGPIVVLLLVVWIALGQRAGAGHPPLGFGNWLVKSRDLIAAEPLQSWLAKLLGGYLLFVAVLVVLIQAPVGFKPLLQGALWPLLTAVLIAAAANALAEEFVYRGFILPAFVQYGGVAAGLWMQGLFFGIIHWGLGVGVLAALPVSMLIGIGSVVWGKATHETGGLWWAVVAHFLVDVAIMGAYFVPH